MTVRPLRRTRTLTGAAIVAAVVSLGMTAHPSQAGGDALSPAAPQASDGARIVACTTAVPPGGWSFRRAHLPPDACRKCEAEGGALEATGNYRAWCHQTPNGSAALYVFCVACRGSENPAATPARFDGDAAPLALG